MMIKMLTSLILCSVLVWEALASGSLCGDADPACVEMSEEYGGMEGVESHPQPLQQGRINGITYWGISPAVAGFPWTNSVVMTWTSDDSDAGADHTFGIPDFVSHVCPPFTLDADDYILGYRVIHQDYISGIWLYTHNNLTHNCTAPNLVYDVNGSVVDGYQDTGDVFYNDSFLTGFAVRTGAVLDRLSFEFTLKACLQCELKLVCENATVGTCASTGSQLGLNCSCRQSCAGSDCNAGQSVGFGGGQYCGTGVCCCGDECTNPVEGEQSNGTTNTTGDNCAWSWQESATLLSIAPTTSNPTSSPITPSPSTPTETESGCGNATVLTSYYGGEGGGDLSKLEQGKITGVVSWGIMSRFGNGFVMEWSSTLGNDTVGFYDDNSAINQVCTPFALDADDYINGYRVIYSSVVNGIVFYTHKGENHSCIADESEGGEHDTGVVHMDGAYLSGFRFKAGGVVDSVSFEFTSTTGGTNNCDLVNNWLQNAPQCQDDLCHTIHNWFQNNPDCDGVHLDSLILSLTDLNTSCNQPTSQPTAQPTNNPIEPVCGDADPVCVEMSEVYGGTQGNIPIQQPLQQGRINGIPYWGITPPTSWYNWTNSVVFNWTSDDSDAGVEHTFGDPYFVTDLCTPFTLDADDYILGYRVIHQDYISGIWLYTHNNLTYNCTAPNLVHDVNGSVVDGYQDTGNVFYNDSFLTGFEVETGAVLDRVSFEFTQKACLQCELKLVCSGIDNCYWSWEETTSP